MIILGTNLYAKGMQSAVNDLIDITGESQGENKLISASDAHVLVMAKTQADFGEILRSYYWNLPDGMPSVWLLKWKGAKTADRISGPDFFKAVICATKNKKITHYLCGGATGVAGQLKTKCEEWGNQNIVGTSSPPFRALTSSDYQDIAHQIQKSNANIIWIGLGAPKQIYFAHHLSKYLQVDAIVTIGAAFDFHTNRVKKAPKWIQGLGLEWLYRLMREPKRLFRRYLKTIPRFMWYGIKEVFRVA